MVHTYSTNPQAKAAADRLLNWAKNMVKNESAESAKTAPTEGKKTTNSGTSNPMEGEPGSCSTCNNSKGNKKQDRYYGSDGWPDKDIDYDHDHKGADGKKVGQPHEHKWDRPQDGSRPTNENRGPAQPVTPKPEEVKKNG